MILPEDILARVILFLLGVFGFWVARKVYIHKKKERPLVCMVGFDCHTVMHSDYSRFLGVKVEVLGLIYYGLVSIFYFLLLLVRGALPGEAVVSMIVISALAFLFSMWLIFVQIFILRKGCSWCIVSALVCTAILVVTVVSYDVSGLFLNFLG